MYNMRGANYINKLINLNNMSVLIMIIVVSIGIGYSAFGTKLRVTDIVATVRKIEDIRISEVVAIGNIDGGISNYTEYNVKNIMSGITLPKENSSVTYRIKVTNIGNVEMGIREIKGLPDNLEYEIRNYKLKEKICDENNKCSLGISKEFEITIKYKEYEVNKINYNINLNIEFGRMYNIKYEGITKDNYQEEIIEGETLEVEFTTPIEKVVPYKNGVKETNYTYENNKITVPNIQNDITLKYVEKVYLARLTEGSYFKESNYINKIKSIKFVDYIDTSDSIKTYDLTDTSRSEVGSIKGWIDSNNNLYIGSEWKIYSEDLSYAFYKMTGVESIIFNNLNTSETTSMYYMFNGMSGLTSLDLSKFDTRNVTNMARMFQGLSKMTNIDVSNFNTGKVTNLSGMFFGMSRLTSLDLSNFDTGNVMNISEMFANCNSLENIDLSNFDTSNVRNMGYMFRSCANLTTLDLSNFDTSKVSTMIEMFYNCLNLTSIDVSSFDTSNVTNMKAMFGLLKKLNELDISNFNTGKVTNMQDMFRSSENLSVIYVGNNWVTSNAITTDMFAGTKVNSVTLKQ